MYRLPANNTLGKTLDTWKGVSWDVTLHVNSRQSITSIHVTCLRRTDDLIIYEGYASDTVQPFDDLKQVIRDLLEDAAVDTHEDAGMQLSLFAERDGK